MLQDRAGWKLTASAVVCGALAFGALQARGRAADTMKVTIQEFALANATGMYDPHDPVFDAEGNGWYTGFGYNALGRINPKTGEVKEFTLPTATSGPHGITVDKQGFIWYTGNRAALVGRLDPKTGQAVEYKMPDAAARDPHTPVFDRNGILWFTVQMGNFVGRLDPKSGEVRVSPVATPKSNPHGIDVDSKGTPVFAMVNTNKLGIVDPKTMAITEVTLPEGARPRRVAISADDAIWYTDQARGFLSRLDRKTMQVKEYPTPGGPKAGPWSIAITKDGLIWYSESDAQPNNLVRFDPKTGATQSWPLSQKGGVVRHMAASADGKALWLAHSGVARMAYVRIGQ
jgi:virginiamycin B lyase